MGKLIQVSTSINSIFSTDDLSQFESRKVMDTYIDDLDLEVGDEGYEGPPPRKILRRLDSVAELTDEQFYSRYRLTKATFEYVVELLPTLAPKATNTRYLSAEKKVLIALRFFATGSFQREIADLEVGLPLTVYRPRDLLSKARFKLIQGRRH